MFTNVHLSGHLPSILCPDCRIMKDTPTPPKYIIYTLLSFSPKIFFLFSGLFPKVKNVNLFDTNVIPFWGRIFQSTGNQLLRVGSSIPWGNRIVKGHFAESYKCAIFAASLINKG